MRSESVAVELNRECVETDKPVAVRLCVSNGILCRIIRFPTAVESPRSLSFSSHSYTSHSCPH